MLHHNLMETIYKLEDELLEARYIRQIQQEQKKWADRNFPDRQSWQPLLGAVEELGELAHSHLKRAQGIRNDKDLDALGKDAVGDTIIYLMDYCNLMGWDMENVIRETWDHVSQRDWRENPVDGGTNDT